MDDPRYVQLVRGNDWGVIYFARPGEALSPQGTSDARAYGLAFHAGQPIRVRWPDGAETQERVVLKIQEVEVSDHGKSYPVRFQLAGIAGDVHGLTWWYPLDAVRVWDDDLPRRAELPSEVKP